MTATFSTGDAAPAGEEAGGAGKGGGVISVYHVVGGRMPGSGNVVAKRHASIGDNVSHVRAELAVNSAYVCMAREDQSTGNLQLAFGPDGADWMAKRERYGFRLVV